MLIHSATQLLTLTGGPQRGLALGTLGIIENGAALLRETAAEPLSAPEAASPLPLTGSAARLTPLPSARLAPVFMMRPHLLAFERFPLH